MTLEVSLKVFRHKAGQRPHFDTFRVQVLDTANVLDAIEAAWAQHDRSLMFRHACHHASCGSCAVRIDGLEKLPCITPVHDVWRGHGELLIEPLRNFPIVSDLVVDVDGFFRRMSASRMVITRTAEAYLPVAAGATDGRTREARSVAQPEGVPRVNRFENCIECGICISACPTMATSEKFMGPAALAGIQRARLEAPDKAESARLLELADGEQGVWRCHSGWECTEACPQGVDPASAIMSLRRDLIRHRIKQWFGR